MLGISYVMDQFRIRREIYLFYLSAGASLNRQHYGLFYTTHKIQKGESLLVCVLF